ncbi:hypothetical protein CEB3_c40510 [Peptococcaceae bacterium CEB3]|nr:hypothetical protein CEB3_c40510 [Peptococcaceae bacterium CEB3]
MPWDCVFCSQPQTEVLAENKLVWALLDRYPLNHGFS